MNVHISYRLHKTPAVEKDIQHQIEKLRKRLQVFRPELIHLKGMVEEISAREGTGVSLNLRLPSGQMAVEAKAPTAAAAVKTAFEDLLQQVNKHKELLRSSHKWPRRQKDKASRRNTSVTKEEVIDETIAAALGDSDGPNNEKPERLALEPWLYRLAMHALDELSRPDGTNGSAVHLEDSARKQNVKASDEPGLQFHQPDEAITEEIIIADRRVATPEQIVGSDEMMHLIASALRDVNSAHREAFILHAIEGFGVDEISAITGAPPETVAISISAARDHLRKSPSFAGQFKGRFAPTGTA